MRPYGLKPQQIDPLADVADIRRAGRKSSVGRASEKCGVHKSYIRSAAYRASIRRAQAHSKRAACKRALRSEDA